MELDSRKFRRMLEQCVRERTATLEAANRELDAFVHSVIHELRAPVRAIDGFAKLLLEQCPDRIAPKARHYLTRIVIAEQRIADMIDALLLLSRLEHKDLRRTEIDVRGMIHQIIADLRAHETQRNVEVTVDQLPPVCGDPVLIRQVFENLLANAFKYTRHRSIARIEVGYLGTDGQTVLFVRDNGAGFDMQCAGKLFGFFERLHCAEEFEGNGIGLAVVRRIIDRHGGRVWAESAREMGATLYVALPEAIDADG